MYRIDPERKKRDRWHRLLNQGMRFALIDASENIKIACRHIDELERLKKRHHLFKVILISEEI